MTNGMSTLETPTPIIRTSGDTVFVDGVGYSVRPEDQSGFIQQQLGGKGWQPSVITTGWQPGGYLWQQREAESRILKAKQKQVDELGRAVSAAEIITSSGKVYTRLGYQKELARLGGFATAGAAVVALRRGTKTEAQYFKEYSVSLQQVREREAAARAAALKPLPAERIPTWLEAQPQVIQRGIGWMAEIPSPQQRLAKTRIAKKVAPYLIKIKEKGSRALFLLGKSRQAISEGLSPEEKDKRKALEQSDKNYLAAVKKYNQEVKKLDKDISRFSAKYIKKPVSQQDTGKAYAIQDELKERAISLEQARLPLEDYEIERKELIKQYDIKIKAVPKIVRWARSMWVGALSAPIAVAGLGIGLAVKPEETITGMAKGIWGLPGAIKEKPIETITELGVSSIVLGLGFKAIRGAVSKAGVMKVKPEITQSFSIGKSIRIGKRGKLNLWKVEGKIITKLKNPKTGKTIETISTKTFSDTVTSPTKSGSIKAYSNTLATSLRTGDIRFALGKTPQIKFKTTLTTAKGELTLNPTDVEKLYRGYGEFGIREIGGMELKYQYPITKATKISAKIKFKAGKEYEGITDLWVKQLGVTKRIDIMKLPKKDIGAIMIGKEYTYSYKALADIYGKGGAKLITRARERGISKAYAPEEGMLFLGAEFKPIKFKAKIPTYKPKIVDMYGKPTKTSQQFQKLITGTPEKAAAKISAQTIQKAIGEVLIQKAKPITIPKAITKVTPIQKAMQLISPSPAIISKQRLKEEQRLRAASLMKLGVMTKPIVRERQRYIQEVSSALAQAFGTKQRQIQVPKLTQIPLVTYPIAQITPPPSQIPTFIIPPPYGKKETQAERRRRKAGAAKIRKQQRAYQASVAAAILGLRLKKMPKRKKYTGLEIRYLLPKQRTRRTSKKRRASTKSIKRNTTYLKRIQNIFR